MPPPPPRSSATRRSASCSTPATPGASAAVRRRSTSSRSSDGSTAPLADASLQQEIRQLVIARNYRRVRAGKPPLDVEAEIRREIEGLTDI